MCNVWRPIFAKSMFEVLNLRSAMFGVPNIPFSPCRGGLQSTPMPRCVVRHGAGRLATRHEARAAQDRGLGEDCRSTVAQ
jgi:hypothetical protein